MRMYCEKCDCVQDAFIVKNKRGETRTYCFACHWSREATKPEKQELTKQTRKAKAF